MRTLARSSFYVLAACATLALASAANAQTGNYYLFSDVPDDGFVVVSGGVADTFPHVTDDLAIAVSGGTIRALQWDLGGNGSKYDLAGNNIGPFIYPPLPGMGG